MSFDLGPQIETPAAQSTVSTPAVSPIVDMSYRNYDGPIKSHVVRWWVVSLALIRTNLKRFGFWLPVVIIILTYLISAALFYGRMVLATAQGTPPASGPSNPFSNEIYGTQAFPTTIFSLFVAALTIGSASIAADNRSNALLVYLSKPLTRLDYLIGKWMAVFLPLVFVLLIPNLLLYGFLGSVYYSQGFFSSNPTLFPRMILASLIEPALHASVVVGISAWSKSSRTAGATYAAFYLILLWIVVAFSGDLKKTHDPAKVRAGTIIAYASVPGIAVALEQRVYNVDPAEVGRQGFTGGRRNRHKADNQDPQLADQQAGDEAAVDALAAGEDPMNDPDKHPPLPVMLLLFAVFTALPVWAAHYKVRAVEVVRG